MKELIIALSGLVIGVACCACAMTYYNNDQYDQIQLLKFENMILRDYKSAYMDHIPKCDTMHKNCVRIGWTQKVVKQVFGADTALASDD